MSALDNRIAAQYRKIETLEARIGRLMSERVAIEEKLAELLEQRNRRDNVRAPRELTGLGRQSDLRPGFYEDDMP